MVDWSNAGRPGRGYISPESRADSSAGGISTCFLLLLLLLLLLHLVRGPSVPLRVSSAYVTLDGSTSVSMIDTQTNQVGRLTHSIRWETPVGIAITPDGRTAYVANVGATASR